MKSFIRFANERHAIYERRREGDSYPWTSDPILRKYKFCNVFRHLDRGSQDFLKLAAPGSKDPLHALFRAALWTVFNKRETWCKLAAVADIDGWDNPRDLTCCMVPKLHDCVDATHNTGVIMFTHAYHCPHAWNRYGATLGRAVINLVTTLISNEDITSKFINAKNLVDASFALTALHGIGPFFAWQITINAWWTKAFQFHDDGRALIGQGSLAGLRLLGDGDKHHIFAQALHACEERGPLYGTASTFRMMGAIDVEHALCEWNKYVDLQNPKRDKEIRKDRIYRPNAFDPASAKAKVN